MKMRKLYHPFRDPRKRSLLCSNLITAAFLLSVIFLFRGVLWTEHYEKISSIRRGIEANQTCQSVQMNKSNHCSSSCTPPGSEALPQGMVSRTTDLEMRTLLGVPYSKEKVRYPWGLLATAVGSKQKESVDKIVKKEKVGSPRSLLAMTVGIKQKESVDKIVNKFLCCNFSVMLFHYDGIVDAWNEFDWSGRVIHVSAIQQTKWWFAKRFLHPDVVSEYKYVFLWDEDIEVENFHPERYIKIVQQEGLEISQPALDASKSEVHHQITMRMKSTRVHRRIIKFSGKSSCHANSTGPRCAGWVEMMVPVFSTASWRCVWYMIQNDLIHGWGLDIKFGYCAQGDRTKKVGVVDAEYVVHRGVPSLGDAQNQKQHRLPLNNRVQVRYRSYKELEIFRQRWNKAAEEDKSWQNPYSESAPKGTLYS